MRLAVVASALALSACGIHYTVPERATSDARAGRLAGQAPPPSREALCRDWVGALGQRDHAALNHVSFPELEPTRSCFAPVTYTPDAIRVAPPPAGCAYPDAAALERMAALSRAPASISALATCALRDDVRAAVVAHNARALAATRAELALPNARRYPYAAAIGFGYGWPDQDGTSIARWRPTDACVRPTPGDLDRLGAMVLRARRVADALHAGVAPLAIVSGGAVHSHMVEAFALLYLLHCELGVARERVLLDPCAQHTHTNVRNSGRWLVALGARTGYIVTDDGIQNDYLQDYGGFELVGGSVDQRALRDWHHLIGTWRQAARGPNVGYWYTPYRFWAEPRDGLGGVSCVDPALDTDD